MREALAKCDMGAVVKAFRTHPVHPRPISQEVAAGWIGISQTRLSRLENGEQIGTLKNLMRWAHVLGIPTDLLWFKVPGNRCPGDEVIRSDPTSPSSTDVRAPAVTVDGAQEDDMERRALLQHLVAGAGVTMSAPALATIEHLRQTMDRLLEGSDTSQTTIERWQEVPHDYALRYQLAPPSQLLGEVAVDFAELQRLLSQRQTVRQRAALCRVSGQLAVLAGIFLAAMGQRRTAQSWFHTARLAASEAGDRELGGLAMVRSSIVSLYYGAPPSVLAQVARAHSLLGQAPTPWRVRALVVEARSLAKLGRRDDARHCLAQAEHAFEQMPTSALGDPALGYTERQFYFTVGNAYTHLGMTAEAGAMHDQALALYRQTEYLDRTLVELDRARCMVALGHADDACRHAVDVITRVPQTHRAGLVTHCGTTLLNQLPPAARALPQARELHDALSTSALRPRSN